jgi:hypothetical protein
LRFKAIGTKPSLQANAGGRRQAINTDPTGIRQAALRPDFALQYTNESPIINGRGVHLIVIKWLIGMG